MPFDVIDVVGLIGLISLLFGIYLVYPPVAFIVGGIIFMGIAYYKAKKDIPLDKG